MNFKEACEIINLDKTATDLEELEAYKVFFSSFGVDIQNQDGSYRSLYDIINEASEVASHNKSVNLFVNRF